MNKRYLLAALLALSLTAISFAYQNSPSHVKWEYKTVVTGKGTPKEMQDLGDDGWELTTSTFQPVGMGGVTTLYFKRPKN